MDVKDKSCIVCGVILSSENTTWYRQKNYIYKCNSCNRDEKRDYARSARSTKNGRKRDTLRSMESRDRMKNNDPVKYSCTQMRSSAYKRSKSLMLDFDLDTDFLVSIAPSLCPVFGFDLKYGGGEKTKNSASLDRIDSRKGYTKDNVQILSSLANTMKSNATIEEMIAFSKWVEKVKGITK